MTWSNPSFGSLERAIGTWSVLGRHPYLPGETLAGRVVFDRIEDGAFVRMRSHMEDPRFPEGVAIFGTDDGNGRCTMLYFDDRGVSRRYEVTLAADGFRWSRDARDLAQRFHVAFSEDGRTMEGKGTMSKEGTWEPDLELTYEKVN